MFSETEWLFSSDEGRVQLHRSAGYERLLVVTLHREHNYDNLDTIKAELGEKVLELAPPNVAKQVRLLVGCSLYSLDHVTVVGCCVASPQRSILVS